MQEIPIKPNKASKQELLFIRKHAPRGMWKLVTVRTGKTRSQVDYQLRLMPDNQDLIVIQAARDILYASTGKRFVDVGKEHEPS